MNIDFISPDSIRKLESLVIDLIRERSYVRICIDPSNPLCYLGGYQWIDIEKNDTDEGEHLKLVKYFDYQNHQYVYDTIDYDNCRSWLILRECIKCLIYEQ